MKNKLFRSHAIDHLVFGLNYLILYRNKVVVLPALRNILLSCGRPWLFPQRLIPFGQMSRQDLKSCIRSPERGIQHLSLSAFISCCLSEVCEMQSLGNSMNRMGI